MAIHGPLVADDACKSHPRTPSLSRLFEARRLAQDVCQGYSHAPSLCGLSGLIRNVRFRLPGAPPRKRWYRAGTPSALQREVLRRACVTWRNVVVVQSGNRQKVAERRHMAQAVPFLNSENHRSRPAMSCNDRRFSVRGSFHQCRQLRLCLSQLNGTHEYFPRTNVVTLGHRVPWGYRLAQQVDRNGWLHAQERIYSIASVR